MPQNPHQKNLFLQHVGAISLSQAIAGIASFLYMIIAARLLKVNDFGLFQALLSVYWIFSLFSMPLHLSTVHCVGIYSGEARRQVGGEFLQIGALAGSLIALFLILTGPLVARLLNSFSVYPIVFTALMIFLRPILISFYGMLQGAGRHLAFSMSVLTEAVSRLLFGSAFLFLKFGPSGAISGYVFAMLCLILFFLTQQRTLYSLQWGFATVRKELRSVGLIMTTLGFYLFMDNFPMMISRARMDADTTGLFGVLFSLRNTLLPFTLAVSVPFYEQILSQEREEPGLFKKAFLIVAGLGTGFLIVALIGSEWLVKTLYGMGYAKAAEYIFLYGVALAIEMLALLILFYQIGKKQMKPIYLLVPLGVMLTWFLTRELTILSAITGQIISWAVFFLVALLMWLKAKRVSGISLKK